MSTHWHQEKVPSQFFFICYITIWNWSYHYCRKRAKKTTVKVGRKKAKKGTTTEEAPTPRTRAAVAREAAAKAKREAQEAELKAAVAREAAEAAAREEAQAARNEFSATQAHEEVMEVMALEVVVPESAIQATTARRYCSSSTPSEVHVYGFPVQYINHQ